MIISHRLIKQLSSFQVFELLKMLGKWTLENRKGGLNLPRFPINLVGTPPNAKIARLILHAAAEEDVVLKQFFRFYLANHHAHLLKGTQSTRDIEPDTKDWGANASWILNYLHDKLLIEFKNQIWQVECMSELILGNPEVRELIQLIRIDTSKIQANLVVLDSNVGKIVMGDETNIYTKEQENKKEEINRSKQKVISEIEKGKTKEAILALYLYFKHDEDEKNKAILLKSRFENNLREYAIGARTQEVYLAELQKINESILNIIN